MKNSIYILLISMIIFGCNNSKKETLESPQENIDYEEIGLNYAFITKKELGKNLMGTIKNKGVNSAVAFCNERAYFITDSISTSFNAKIKRVSDKPRNSDNAANKKELNHIETFKDMLTNEQEMKPILEENGTTVNFYYPIITNDMCLQCHGTENNEMKSNVYKTIKALYPLDQAIGYGDNQVRGIWSISFEK